MESTLIAGQKSLPMSAIQSVEFSMTIDRELIGAEGQEYLADIMKVIAVFKIPELKQKELICEIHIPAETFFNEGEMPTDVLTLLTIPNFVELMKERVELDMQDLDPDWFK